MTSISAMGSTRISTVGLSGSERQTGLPLQNEIALEPTVYAALLRYVAKIQMEMKDEAALEKLDRMGEEP